LPCGPRIAEEKESGFPAPSRFKSAGAGENTGGAVVGPKRKRGGLVRGGCGSVVVKAEGVSRVVYKVGKVIQVWVGRGGVVGGVVVRAAGVWGVVYKVGKWQAERLDQLRHFSDGRGVRGSTLHPAMYTAGWGPSRLGVGGRLGRCCPRQAPNDGEALESSGGTGGRGVGGRVWGKVRRGKVEEG
jgi:hypothetical protein